MAGMLHIAIRLESASAPVPARGPPAPPPAPPRHKVGPENRSQHHSRVTRVGEVIHRPTEHFAFAHIGVECALGKQVYGHVIHNLPREQHKERPATRCLSALGCARYNSSPLNSTWPQTLLFCINP